MADEVQVTQAELEQLADKLEQIEFTDKERAVLMGVITAAGGTEVEGFAAPPVSPFGTSSKVGSPVDGGFRSALLGTMQPGRKIVYGGGTRSVEYPIIL